MLGHPELLTLQPGGLKLFRETISLVTGRLKAARARVSTALAHRAAGHTIREAKGGNSSEYF